MARELVNMQINEIVNLKFCFVYFKAIYYLDRDRERVKIDRSRERERGKNRDK